MAANSAYTEAHDVSGRLVVANDGTDVGKGQRKRAKQEGPPNLIQKQARPKITI